MGPISEQDCSIRTKIKITLEAYLENWSRRNGSAYYFVRVCVCLPLLSNDEMFGDFFNI